MGETTHEIEVLPGTLLSSILRYQGSFPVNSFHHQAVSGLPRVVTSAVAAGGAQVVSSQLSCQPRRLYAGGAVAPRSTGGHPAFQPCGVAGTYQRRKRVAQTAQPLFRTVVKGDVTSMRILPKAVMHCG